jgi:NAD(P)-dependent dehydrogenase (short-subunit alcohol dehydrogenase family)
MKSILVTGANRGIGLELVRQFLEQGSNVLACCRSPNRANELLDLKNKFKNELKIYELDVTNNFQIQKLSDELKNETIDIFINNAGVYGQNNVAFGNVDINSWIEVFKTNTIAPLKLIEAFIRQISNSDRKIVATISSELGSITENTTGGDYLYRSSKAAVNIVIKSLAIDLKQKNIIVIALHPGWVKTDMGGPNATLNVEESVRGLREIINNVTLKESGQFLAYDGRKIPW